VTSSPELQNAVTVGQFKFALLFLICTSFSMQQVETKAVVSGFPASAQHTKTSGPLSAAELWPTGFSMYEISTRPWLYNLSLKYEQPITTLSQIPDEEFLALKQAGIDMVWMMGVWQLGAYGLNYDQTNAGLLAHYAQVLPGYTTQDIIGSPYAVVDYTLNSELGSESDLKALRDKLHSMGLLLMLDFVPNHTAVDCPWTSSNINYYIRAPKGQPPPYDSNVYLANGIAYGSSGYGAWQDTAQLNYWNPELAKERINQLLYVASLSDGIRCDMAYLLLNDLFQQNWGEQLSSWGWTRPAEEWWTTAISAVKQQYPNTILLAEVYSPYKHTLQGLGFDYTYDKQLYDRLGNGDLDSVRAWLTDNSLDFHTHSAHFVSNHDEPRAATYFGSWYRADAAALLTFTLPGLRFFWEGEWAGYTWPLDIHLRREKTQPANDYVLSMYKSLTAIVSDDVFKKGQWTYLNVFGADTAGQLIAYRWNYKQEKRLCILNFSGSEAQGRVIVADAQPVNGNDTIPITDLLTNTTYYRSATDMRTNGLYVIINQWWAQIFTY
jgi:glycosidase